MDKLDKINQARRLLFDAHEILDELRKEAKGKVLDPRRETDMVDIYILWAAKGISEVQTKMDVAVEHVEREASHESR